MYTCAITGQPTNYKGNVHRVEGVLATGASADGEIIGVPVSVRVKVEVDGRSGVGVNVSPEALREAITLFFPSAAAEDAPQTRKTKPRKVEL